MTPETETTPDQFEVQPNEDGTWAWRKRVDGQVVDQATGYESRGEAITAARAENGNETLKLVREDDTVAGVQRNPGELRIVLLRTNGDLVGELDHPPSTATGPPQRVSLTPATETGEALSL